MTPVITAIRQLSPETRILLIAGKEDVERIIPLFGLGVHDVLMQPINPKKAITAIQKLLVTNKKEASDVATPNRPTVSHGGEAYRPQHVVSHSAPMRIMIAHLWKLRQEPLGIILSGEPGVEFEVVAREYQSICGDPNGFLMVLSPQEITTEGLSTACSMDRLKDGMPCTFLVQDVDKLPALQQDQLVDFLRLSKRRYDRNKPLRFVFTVTDAHENGRVVENPFVEEFLFAIPNLVKIPPLRERREDIEPLARKLLLDLTAIHPEYRVRSINALTLEWLCGRLWRGNYMELCSYLRQAVMECTHRELSMTYFTARDTASPFANPVHGAKSTAMPVQHSHETLSTKAETASPETSALGNLGVPKPPLAPGDTASPFLASIRPRMAF